MLFKRGDKVLFESPSGGIWAGTVTEGHEEAEHYEIVVRIGVGLKKTYRAVPEMMIQGRIG